MKALVTGGLGFIGSNLVDMLIDKGWDVIVIDNLSTGNLDYTNTKAHYCIKDLNDITIEDMNNCDYIFHTAALPRIQPSFEDPLSHDFANVTSTIKLIQCATKNKNLKKIVYSSSSSVYGSPKNNPTTETEQIDPLSPYALQKYASERYIHILCDRYGIPFITLRYFNVYGNRSFNKNNIYSAYTSVIGIFQNQKKEEINLTITGDGQQKRDFVNVLDVVNANYMAAISDVSGECFNIGYGKCYTILEIAKMFNCQYKFIPERKGEALITHADITKIQKMINWYPSINFKDYVMDINKLIYLDDTGQNYTRQYQNITQHENITDKILYICDNMNNGSIVFDVGAHIGESIKIIHNLYNNCNIHAFEPIGENFNILAKINNQGTGELYLNNFALGNKNEQFEITIDGTGSSEFTHGKKEMCTKIKFIDYITENSIDTIDLLKINIEGSEYELLDSIIESNWITNIKNILIQFHNFADIDNNNVNTIKRRKQIVDKIKETHTTALSFPFCWERYTLK